MVVWPLWKRVSFRFGFVFFGLLMYPFPIDSLSVLDPITHVLAKPVHWIVNWFGEAILGLPEMPFDPSGSGDRTSDYVALLVFGILASLAATIWSVLDRRRTDYTRLAGWSRVALRYMLATAMLSYGLEKVFRLQFGDITANELDVRYTDKSPMGVLWSFMNYSTSYTVFGGLAEVVGGLLLLWRRTQTLGALVLIGVMTNVVMLNFSYDVPVKLYSSQLLVMAMLVALPDARRTIAAVLGRAVPELPPRERGSRRMERARLAMKIAMLAIVVGGQGYELHDTLQTVPPSTEVDGNWKGDGEIRMVSISPRRGLSLRHADDTREGGRATIDTALHRLTVMRKDGKEEWSYVLHDPDHLELVGALAGKTVSLALTRVSSPLMSRGFHWIQENPYNR